MNSSMPNTPQAESRKPSTGKLTGMTMDQKADWFAQQAVIGLNSAATKARQKAAQTPDQKADWVARELVGSLNEMAAKAQKPTGLSEEAKNLANRQFAEIAAQRAVEGLRRLARQKESRKVPSHAA